jgi:hypothetical protein
MATELGTVDLNLPVVFDAILPIGDAAGQRLGLSQPAMSHALIRTVRPYSERDDPDAASGATRDADQDRTRRTAAIAGAGQFDPSRAKTAFRIADRQ